MNNPIWPKFEIVRFFMPDLVTCKFDKDSIKGDWAKLETSFFFTAQVHVTPKWPVKNDRNSNLSEIFMLLIKTSSPKGNDRSPESNVPRSNLVFSKGLDQKQQRKSGDIISPILVNGGFLMPWKPEFRSNLPQNHLQPFPRPDDATYKIWPRLVNWLQRYWSSKVWISSLKGK